MSKRKIDSNQIEQILRYVGKKIDQGIPNGGLIITFDILCVSIGRDFDQDAIFKAVKKHFKNPHRRFVHNAGSSQHLPHILIQNLEMREKMHNGDFQKV